MNFWASSVHSVGSGGFLISPFIMQTKGHDSFLLTGLIISINNKWRP